MNPKLRRGRIPKRQLFEIVEEARKCLVGPREIGHAIGYNHQHISRVAMVLGFPKLPSQPSRGEWSLKLKQMVDDISDDLKPVAPRFVVCEHCGGTVRPQET